MYPCVSLHEYQRAGSVRRNDCYCRRVPHYMSTSVQGLYIATSATVPACSYDCYCTRLSHLIISVAGVCTSQRLLLYLCVSLYKYRQLPLHIALLRYVIAPMQKRCGYSSYIVHRSVTILTRNRYKSALAYISSSRGLYVATTATVPVCLII